MKEVAKLAYAHESHVRDCVMCDALRLPTDALTALNIVADHQENWNINDWRDWWENVGRPASQKRRSGG